MHKDAETRALPFENEAEANAALHEVSDAKGFRTFQARVRETQKSRKTVLRVRKRHRSEAFSFAQAAGDPKKVDYLYADGGSTGRCHWSSLWRVIEVEIEDDGSM